MQKWKRRDRRKMEMSWNWVNCWRAHLPKSFPNAKRTLVLQDSGININKHSFKSHAVRIKIHKSWDMMCLRGGMHMNAHTYVLNYFNWGLKWENKLE